MRVLIPAFGIAAAIVFLSLWLSERRARIQVTSSNKNLAEQVALRSPVTAGNPLPSTQAVQSSSSDTNAAFQELLKLRGEVGLLRKDVSARKSAASNAKTISSENPQPTKEIAEKKVALAQDNFRQATAKFEAGIIASDALKEAEAQWEIAQAEAAGDLSHVLAIKSELASVKLMVAEKKRAAGVITVEEYNQLKFERDYSIAETQGDLVGARRIKLDAAEEQLKIARVKQQNGLDMQEATARFEMAKVRAEAELKDAQEKQGLRK